MKKPGRPVGPGFEDAETNGNDAADDSEAVEEGNDDDEEEEGSGAKGGRKRKAAETGKAKGQWTLLCSSIQFDTGCLMNVKFFCSDET